MKRLQRSKDFLVKVLLVVLLVGLVSGCGLIKGSSDDIPPQTETQPNQTGITQPTGQTGATLIVENPEAVSQSIDIKIAPTAPEAQSFGVLRYRLDGGDEVCGIGRTVPEGLRSFTVSNSQVVESIQPAAGFTTTGSSVFAQGSLYNLANRYCQLNAPFALFVRASEIGNALDGEK